MFLAVMFQKAWLRSAVQLRRQHSSPLPPRLYNDKEHLEGSVPHNGAAIDLICARFVPLAERSQRRELESSWGWAKFTSDRLRKHHQLEHGSAQAFITRASRLLDFESLTSITVPYPKGRETRGCRSLAFSFVS